MRAWAVVETGKPLQEIEMPTPEPTGAQVLLEVTHAGVCHSDLHIWEGEYDLGSRGKMRLTDRGVVLPLAMGHEIVGRVVKLGPEAANQGTKVGDLRVVYPWVGCGKCAICQREEENMCLTPRSLGVYQNGGYATHVLATHVRHLVDIEGVDPALAATYACSGVTVYSAINKLLPLEPNEPVVLVGAGGLGLQAVAILKALGHQRICAVDVDQKKLDAAKQQGASDTVLAAGEETAKRIIEACGGPVAGIIDLVNGTQTARFAFDALRKGGKLVQVGLFGGEMNIPLPLMPIRALTIQGSYVGNVKELRALIDIAKQGKIPGIPVETTPQKNADAVLNRLKNGQITGRVVLVGEAA
ncbi:alcohol dehydrogenase [Paracraurococcus ruber]|uniref:alcohol dehydrogenase n=1 Tax=Paracraurococcus ruber TaxID=77675 RepID=A0ABS1D6U4_9PROT|nr:alcohol dehydrogenase [Paracraurococcus ruber]MBK1661802.1 alcohol dehydrogenase [Paracraurococcus ruber]TDG31590.1 alcohol dehydrogenase [Paracraurococcus ruber]